MKFVLLVVISMLCLALGFAPVGLIGLKAKSQLRVSR